jgi:hypothetical protein
MPFTMFLAAPSAVSLAHQPHCNASPLRQEKEGPAAAMNRLLLKQCENLKDLASPHRVWSIVFNRPGPSSAGAREL